MKSVKTSERKPDPFRWFGEALDLYLAKKNLKQTKQRQAIVSLFLSLKTHVSAESLHAAARAAGLDIGLATIYRTLNLLTEAGLTEQKQFGEGHVLYEVVQPGAHHDHLICLDCGKVLEFENAEIERLQQKVAAIHEFKLTSHRLDLFGHCLKKACKNRAG